MNKQQQILFAIFFSSINADVHVNKRLEGGLAAARSQRFF